MSWDEHLAYLSPRWEPGQHVGIVAPTGRGGKSYLTTKGLLPLWQDYNVLYVDNKDADPTISHFGHRVESFPSKLAQAYAKEPKWFRLHVKSGLAGMPMLTQRMVVYRALAKAYRQFDRKSKKGWVVVVGEVKFVAHELNLVSAIRDILTRGRTQVTFIGETQSPSWVPSEFYDQPTYLYLGRLNADGNKRLGEIGGTIDYKFVRSALAGVRKHEFLFIDKAADEPEEAMQIVKVGA